MAKKKVEIVVKNLQELKAQPEEIVIKNRPVIARSENQKKYIQSIINNVVTIAVGEPGTGKAQPLDSIVYTTNGPKLMGDIIIGDKVCTPDGKFARVIGVFPQGKKSIYKISFSDGYFAECSKDHLWQVSTDNLKDFKNQVVDTDFLIHNIRQDYYIPITKTVEFESQEIKIDPYFLGLLLGDGSFRSGQLKFTSADSTIIDKIQNRLQAGYNIVKVNGNKYDYTINSNLKANQVSGIQNQYILDLMYYKLWGLLSHEKFIPKEYIYNTKEVRLDIIKGLMDSDGTVSNNPKLCNVSFCTTSLQLAKDVTEIIESLGGLCTTSIKKTSHTYKNVKKSGKIAYNLNIRLDDKTVLFDLERKKTLVNNNKKYHTKRFIDYIDYIGEKECQCILLDNDDHLYLTNHFITTHNTSLAVGMALDFLIKGKVDRIIVTRPVLEAAHEKLGFLPGAINEKMDPYIAPIYDELEVYLDKEAIKKLLTDKKIIVIPLAFMRGRNLKGFIILDEAQNCTKEQLKLFLTRLCPGSRAVLNGDTKQSDLPLHLQGDFDKLSKAFKNVPGIGVVHLDRIDNNRHEIVPVITEIMENMDKPRYLEDFHKNKFYNDDDLGSYEDRVD